MEHSVALQVITTEALNMAIAKGCFNLIEVTNIVKALEEIHKLPTIEFSSDNEEVI
jgi:hypothetical protein